MSGIYDQPELYQLACAYRDVPTEVSAMLSWCAKHWRAAQSAQSAQGAQGAQSASGDKAPADIPPGDKPPADGQGIRSVLELAAGPAEHARELARRGLHATALDRSAPMCAYAAAQAKAEGLELDVVEADMRDFSLPSRFDLAITMLNSICHLYTLDDLVAHLKAVAAHQDPGGLYVIELAHPADYLAPVPRTSSEWTIEKDGIRAEVRWGGHQDRIDPVTQITAEHMSITAHSADGTVRTVSDVVPNRFWTATEMTAAIRLAARSSGAEAKTEAMTAGGYTLAAAYGDFNDTTMLDDSEAWRMILVLRRE